MYKYTPTTLDDFELANKVDLLQYTNVLLLGGEHTGKTTLASIIVSMQSTDTDNVLFINALKEQGIQYFRTDVKCFCQTTSKSKKIIVIDGVDDINEQTQQILLHYMDMFPHIQFIVTGSNPQKIIESIYSNCMIIQLLPVSDTYMQSLVRKVNEAECITMDDDAIQYLISLSNHSVRTLLNYIEKYKWIGLPITQEFIRHTHTDIHKQLFEKFTIYIQTGDKKSANQCILELYEDGYSVMDILDAYYEYIKVSAVPEILKYKYIKVICKYIAIFNLIHEHNLELLFFVNDCINISSDSHS